MADNESTTEGVAEEPTKQIVQRHEARDRLFRLLQILLPAIGVFAALSYFLGRLFLEAYYYALGITPHVLQFSPEDYMFSSFNLVVMCFAISTWLYFYWWATRSGIRLVLGFPIAKGQKWPDLLTDIEMLLSLFIMFGLATWNLFGSKNYGTNTPGFIGLNAGSVIGVGMILLASFMQWFARSSKLSVLPVIFILLALLASIPSITNRLAKIEARTNMENFPTAIIVSKDALPAQLQMSPSTPTESITVKLIITNNGMTYVLNQDNEQTNEWQIYAIQEDDIKQIIYLYGK